MVRTEVRCSAAHDDPIFHILRRSQLTLIKTAAILLIVAGVVALMYGGFSYVSETHNASRDRSR